MGKRDLFLKDNCKYIPFIKTATLKYLIKFRILLRKDLLRKVRQRFLASKILLVQVWLCSFFRGLC